jgi:hypothetical protein
VVSGTAKGGEMSQFGTCQKNECTHPAVVGLSGVFLCQQHFDDALKETKDVVGGMFKAAFGHGP